MNTSFSIINRFKLDDYLKIVLEKSTSNHAPYHNLFHVLCMIKNCHLIAVSENLNPSEIRLLLIAVLFHDFGHSMGAKKDTENVKDAIKAFEKYSKESPAYNQKIIEIIKATEYPYVIDEKDLTFEQKVIRDADLLQLFEPNYIQQNLLGLSKEMNLPIIDLLKGQKKFMDSIKYHTAYAKAVAEEMLKSRYEDGEYLLALLER